MDKELTIKLVKAVQAGDRKAAGQLYEESYRDVYYFILKTVKEKELAEDLTQDAFIQIMRDISNLQEPEAFVGWSRQIAYRSCTAYFRKRKELLVDENEDGSTVFDTITEENAEFIPHEALDKEDLKKTILAMIDSLPQEQRSALILRYYEELPVSQIAKIQNVSEGTVKSRLNYGRNAVRKSVEAYEKKNGVKLHSFAILPLLLWLFRKQKLAAGKPITAGASAGAAVAGKAAAGAASKGFFATVGGKITAAVLAVAVVAGGVAAVVTLDGSGKDSGKNQDHKEGNSVVQQGGEETPVDDGLVDYWLQNETNGKPIEYDENYNMVKYYSGYWYRNFTYNENNRLETMTITRKDGGLDTHVVYHYDAEGNIIRADETFEDPTVPEHNAYAYENGKLVREEHYNANGKLKSWETKEYDDQGRLAKVTRGWGDDYEDASYSIYTYNEEGELISVKGYDYETGERHSGSTYYYENGKCVKIVDSNIHEAVTHYEYDENGNVSCSKSVKDGKVVGQTNYTYTKVRVTPERAKQLDKNLNIAWSY